MGNILYYIEIYIPIDILEVQSFLLTFANFVGSGVTEARFRSEIIEDPSSTVEWVIINYAELESVDLIVMGTRGKSGFKRALLGSVASGVLSHAHCPVMIIR